MAKTSEVELRLGIHDASRVEWVAELPLPRQRATEFELEMRAEVPAHVFSAHDHWEHLQVLARLSSPTDDALPIDSERFSSVDELRRSTLAAVQRLKAVCESLLREIFTAVSLFSRASRTGLAEDLLAGIHSGLAELHKARAALGTQRSGEPDQLTRERAVAAEFLSNHAIEFLSKVQRAVDEQLCGPKASRHPDYERAAERLRPQLASALRAELEWRRERGFTQPDGDDPVELERYVERASVLKKHFQELLFLQVRMELAKRRFRNWFAVVGALFAALWAFPLGLLLAGNTGVAGLGLGFVSTVALFSVSYAIKDRIKELVRDWLTTTVASGYAGRISTFSTPARVVAAGQKLMKVRETFFTSEEQRPDPVNPDLGQNRPVVLLRYAMRGALEGDAQLTGQGHDHVRLVFRYDLSPLFAKLDDPIKRVPVLAEDGQTVRFAEAPRCYRIPVTIRLRFGKDVTERAGILVAHKLGLERMERVLEPGRDRAIARERIASVPNPMLRRR